MILRGLGSLMASPAEQTGRGRICNLSGSLQEASVSALLVQFTSFAGCFRNTRRFFSSFCLFLLRFKRRTSNATKTPPTPRPLSRDRARLRPRSPETPPTTGTAATTTVRDPTQAPTAGCVRIPRRGSGGRSSGGASGGAAAPPPSSPSPTWARPVSAPPAPPRDPPPGAAPSTGATLSCRRSGSTWTRWSGRRRRTWTRGTG